MINYKLNDLTDRVAVKRCPTDAIVWIEGLNQFAQKKRSNLPLGRVEKVFDKDEYYQ